VCHGEALPFELSLRTTLLSYFADVVVSTSLYILYIYVCIAMLTTLYNDEIKVYFTTLLFCITLSYYVFTIWYALGISS
jgi:hypothetical protein